MKKRKLLIITVLTILLVFTSFVNKETLAKEKSGETGCITNADESESYLSNGNKLIG